MVLVDPFRVRPLAARDGVGVLQKHSKTIKTFLLLPRKIGFDVKEFSVRRDENQQLPHRKAKPLHKSKRVSASKRELAEFSSNLALMGLVNVNMANVISPSMTMGSVQ
jgi:cell shape-determining protein MreC